MQTPLAKAFNGWMQQRILFLDQVYVNGVERFVKKKYMATTVWRGTRNYEHLMARNAKTRVFVSNVMVILY